ncbi:hypothetical protein HOD20_09275 [archaeon]|jgi:hypothetical protein|nr:hypothetical protein [archaeon]MBT4648175.1 hypothetical protein [archaeon]MBT6822407.1 hypothetical protein [archaeon]MBT7391876.1 hypothetical protein [archaeon]
MDPITFVTKYSFITNKLKYCGPDDSYIKFLEYIKNPNEKLASEIRNYMKRFEGLYPYLDLISKKTNLDFLSEKVVEAYWIGSDLLDDFDENDLKEMITALSKRGLPKSYAKKLCDGVPKGMVPHHSFNVIYVGVGKVTGSVEFNIDNINNCLIRWGKVKKINENKVTLSHQPYIFENKKMILSNEKEDEFEYLPEFIDELKIGDNVSHHWNVVVDKLTDSQKKNLIKYTNKNVEVLNNGL